MKKFKDISLDLLRKIRKLLYIPKIIISKKYLVCPDNPHSIREYKDLAPEQDLTNASEYYKALDWALNNERIMNIAIAGPYGSGKSSIIRAYLKRHPELKYINISLANFLEYSESGSGELIDLGEGALELGILKQLFYKVNYRKIPQSRYRKLRSFKKRYVASGVLLIAILGIIFCMFVIPDFIKIVLLIVQNAEENFGLARKWIYIISGVSLLACFYFISNIIWRFSSRAKIKEVNIGSQATVSTDESRSDDSIFDRNMDEIVYFFEATGYNVVFLEDLDRFNSADIFVKLRELNTILNNYEVIRKRIVFVYAIKDDMFTEKERTKFFEFILPVIPIINATNSGEILLKKMSIDGDNTRMRFNITMDYITLISPFIDDMRILTNTYNEFLTYKYTLQGEQDLNLSDQLMFSLMVFKNIYPKDFADLQAEKGIVKEAFETKKIIINSEREKLENQKQELIDILESIDSDTLNNAFEIKVSMLYFMTNSQGIFRLTSTSLGQFDFFDIMQSDFDLNKLRGRNSVEYYYSSNSYTNNIDFDGNLLFAGDYDYISRYNYLVNGAPERKIEIQKQIEAFDKKIYELSALSLKDLIELYDAEELLPESVKKNRLLVFLLRYGYIDEKYPNYMNYFHANSITKEDMNYILSVRNREAESFEYPLSKVRQIVKRLLPYEFEQREIYNFDLMYFLLSSESEKEKLNLFFKQLANEKEDSWKFINEYVNRIENQEGFIKGLSKYWKGFWDYVFTNPVLLIEKKDNYLNLICTYAEEQYIQSMNENGNIAKYLIQDPDILLRMDIVPIAKIMKVIELCEVRFDKLEISGVNEELLDWIFQNNYYKITIAMLKNIIIHKSPEYHDEFMISCHSTIMKLAYTPLLDYINLHFKEYVDEIVLGIFTNTEESIEAVLDIIKRCEERDLIQILIQKEDVMLDQLERCDWEGADSNHIKTIWGMWIDNNKLNPNWENVTLYWHHNGADSTFIKYLTWGVEQLIQDEIVDATDPSMIAEIIKSDMEIDTFEKLMKKLSLTEFNIPLSKINQEHLSILIKLKYFKIIPDHISELRDLYPELVGESILVNKDSILEKLTDYILTKEDIEFLILSQDLNENDKLSFIYSMEPTECTTNIAMFLRGVNRKINEEWFSMAWDILETDKKYELFINQIEFLSNNEIAEKMDELDDDYKKFADRSRRHEERLADTDYNARLVEHLKRVDYITSSKVEEKTETNIITQERTTKKFITCWVKKA